MKRQRNMQQIKENGKKRKTNKQKHHKTKKMKSK